MSILTETADGIARIQIARPERKNAITGAMYTALADALTAAEADASVRVMLLHGQPDIFSAGNDLEDFLRSPPQGADAPVFRFMGVLAGAAKPVVAAVNGAAVGIGTTLLLHCDLAYCADDSRFSLPFVNLALCPEFGSSLLLPLSAGYHRAAEKLMLGEPASAEEALEMGLVNRALPPAEVLGYARRQCERLAKLPPNALRETKRLLKAGWRAAIERAISDESAAFARLLVSDEARQAFGAFLERRTPR
ncbi:MAG TPA: enoyl-CoA hydratase [Burkholderiaceae bacterium]|jgi:enoyl-CoA hydratase/carnithine racemase|nr:enoyl-CoA hydratase [Burkholderiaceae bacterium]